MIKFSRLKNDQEGASTFPRHLYANPYEPSACPVLRYIKRYLILCSQSTTVVLQF